MGRGAAKSTCLYKLATFFALFGVFDVPSGERHFAIVLSRLKEEASKGITIIAAWLRMLNVAHGLTGDVIELHDMPRGIRIVAASVAAASGWRAFFVGKDERSKWPAGGVEGIDAEEVDTSAGAMTATHALAPVVSFGSAWGDFGSFYNAIASGSDDAKIVLGPTPTWIAAPHIREEDCRRKERDSRRFAREYECKFQGTSSAFDTEVVAKAFRTPPPNAKHGERVLLIDPSSGRSDAWTYAIASWAHPDSPPPFLIERAYLGNGRYAEQVIRDDEGNPLPNPDFAPGHAPFFHLELVAGVEGVFWKQLPLDHIVARLAALCRKWNIRHVFSDQREAYALESLFGRHGLRLFANAWTNENKVGAVERLRRWFREETIVLPVHEKLKIEIATFEEKITPSGAITFGARGTRHDDYVALLLTAAIADAAGQLSLSPYAPPRRYINLTHLPTV